MAENAGTVNYFIDADTADVIKGMAEVKKQNDMASKSFQNLDKNVTGMNTKLNQATKGIRLSSHAMGQLGFQIQDIASMVSFGASPFTIIATQGSQIASIFGPGGAVAGAFIGIAAILGGVLFNSISSASGELDEFTEQVKELTESELAKLEGALKAVALQMFSDEAKELTAQQADLNAVINRQVTSIDFLKKKYDALSEAGKANTEEAKDLKRAIDIGNTSLTKRQAALQLVNQELETMLRKSGILKGEVTDLKGKNDELTESEIELKNQTKSAEDQISSLRQQVELASTALVGTAEDVKIMSEKQKLGSMVSGEYSAEIERLTKRLLTLKDQLKVKDQIKSLSDAVTSSKFSVSGLNEEQFIYNELMKVGSSATEEQKKEIMDLSQELFMLKTIQGGLGGPTQLGMAFTGDMQDIQQQLDLQLISHEEFLAQKLELEQNYEEQLKEIQEERFRRESESNAALLDGLDALGSTATNVFSGMLNGTMSLTDGIRAMANTILNQAISSIVQLGVEYVKNQIIGQTSAAATAAAAAATGTAMAASYAPAAALASLASFGANSAPAQAGIATTVATTKALSLTGRENGGPTAAGNMFRVGEGNKPEIFVPDGLSMIPGENGRVFNKSQLDQMMGGGNGEGINVTVINEPGVVSTVMSQDEKNLVIQTAVNLAEQKHSQSMQNKTGSYYNATKQNWGNGTTNGRPT